MGRGRSAAGGNGGGGSKGGAQVQPPVDYPEAFQPGKDYQAVGGVDHNARTVSRTTQREWDQFAGPMNNGVTSADEYAIMRQYSDDPNMDGDYVTGYVRTRNSFTINKILYDENNLGKTDSQMFTRQADIDTLKALDKSIANNTTQADGSYTRFSGMNGIQSTLGLSDGQMTLLRSAGRMTPDELADLNKAIVGKKTYNPSYTSASANRSLNAFSNPYASQSQGYWYERKMSMPKGVNAFAPRGNAQESEVIFGRRLSTTVTGISVASDGHIVIHEMFDGYK